MADRLARAEVPDITVKMCTALLGAEFEHKKKYAAELATQQAFSSAAFSRGGISPPGLARVEVPPRGEVFYAHGMASIGNRDIAAAQVVETSYGSHDVGITFTSEGSARIKSLTEQNLGKRLVISVAITRASGLARRC